ncbi:MAG: hypothetical protein ACYC7D_13905 [Nitrososphaerales archaeon]
MKASRKIVVMIIVGIMIAAGIIAGVTALEENNFLPSVSQTVTTNRTFTSTATSITTQVSTTTKTSNSTGPTGTLAAMLTDPSLVPPGTSAFYVSYSDVEAHTTAGNSSEWITISGAGAMNLMGLSNQSVTLGSARISSGLFNQVRFDILSATLTYYGANYSIFVSNSHLIASITSGGINVKPNASAGIIIDLATTVLPFQDGPKVSFVMTPTVSSNPIPPSSWNTALETKGAALNLANESWFVPGPTSLQGSLTRLIGEISPATLLIALQNTGNTSITISSLTVLGSSTQNQSLSTSTFLSTVTSVVTITQVTTITENSTSTGGNQPASGRMNPDALYTTSNSTTTLPNSSSSQYIAVASFQILNDSALAQPGQSINPNSAGLTIPPGKQVVLLFVGQISTLDAPTAPYSPTSIVGGQQYLIMISSPSGAVYNMNVTASFQS